jgi:hypothetical protein
MGCRYYANKDMYNPQRPVQTTCVLITHGNGCAQDLDSVDGIFCGLPFDLDRRSITLGRFRSVEEIRNGAGHGKKLVRNGLVFSPNG